MHVIDEDIWENKGRTIFIILAIFKYVLGIAIAYWGSRIFYTLGQVYKEGLSDNLTGIDCLQCPILLKQSGILLTIFGIFLIILWAIDKTKDYLPAGIIWIFSGIFFLFPRAWDHQSGVLGIYSILFIWWLSARAKESSKLLGYIQIFMPLTLIGVIFTDDISVWLFGIFLSISLEGIYLTIEGASDLAFAMLVGVENDIDKQNVIRFLQHLKRILHIQRMILWPVLAILFIDVIAAFSRNNTLQRTAVYGYIIIGTLYYISWWYMAVGMKRVHRSFGMLLYIALGLILFALLSKFYIGNTFLAVIGILTGISIISPIGPVYEMIIRKHTSAIMFDIYMDHVSIAMLLVLLGTVLYNKNTMMILVSVAPFMLIILGFTTKLLILAFVLDATTSTLTNINYALQKVEDKGGKIQIW